MSMYKLVKVKRRFFLITGDINAINFYEKRLS